MVKKTSKVFMSVFIIAAMVFTLGSCGSPSEESRTEDQILTIATYTDGSDCIMDPQMTWSYGDWQYNNQLYDTLVTADFDGQTIKDALAESWEVSDNGMIYTFHLKEGVKFHSGKEFTSEDVKWTYERWKTNPETAYSYYLDYVDSIECPDDRTVVINLTQNDNNLLINLTSPVASIMNGDAVAQAEADGQVYGVEVIDGTGPFKFVEYISSDHLTMVRNEDYTWGSSIFENQSAPYIKTLTYRYIPEAGTRLMELKGGNINILGNGCTFANEIEGLKADGLNVVEFNPPYPVFLMFQTERVPDISVRKAINMGIDRDEIISTVMNGHASKMVGALPSDYPTYWKGQDGLYPYNPDAAAKLLEDNGYTLAGDGYRYKDGKLLSIEISYCASEEDAKTAVLFQSQMKNIGIDVVVNTSTSDFWTRISGDGDNNFDVLIMGLFINTTEDMLQEYLYSKNMPAPNRSKWSSPEVDELLFTARSTTDITLKQKCYDEIQKIAMEDNALWVPLYSRGGWIVTSSNVKGYRAHPTIVEGEPKLIDVYIE